MEFLKQKRTIGKNKQNRQNKKQKQHKPKAHLLPNECLTRVMAHSFLPTGIPRPLDPHPIPSPPEELSQVKNTFEENFPRKDEWVLKYSKLTRVLVNSSLGKGWIKLQ